MNVKDTLYFAMVAFSGLNRNRARALNSLFCVNGNGYYWVGGELVDRNSIKYPKRSLKTRIQLEWKWRRAAAEAEKTRRAEYEQKRLAMSPEETAKDKTGVDEWMKLIIAGAEKRRKEREADPEKYEAEVAESIRTLDKMKLEMAEDEKYEYSIPDNFAERQKDTAFNNWYPMSKGYCYLLDFPTNIKPDWLDALIETADLILAQPNVLNRYTVQAQIDHNQQIARKARKAAIDFKNRKIS